MLIEIAVIGGIAVAGTVALVWTGQAACPAGRLTAEVTHVRDGDTIVVGRTPVRLSGLAAPEKHSPGGSEAAAAVTAWTLGKVVSCDLDGKQTWDRCSGTCYLDGVDVAEALIAAGLARDCPAFSGGRYRAAEEAAAGRGAVIHDTYPLPSYCD